MTHGKQRWWKHRDGENPPRHKLARVSSYLCLSVSMLLAICGFTCPLMSRRELVPAFDNACRAVMDAHGPDPDTFGASGWNGRFFSLSAETRRRKAELQAAAPSEDDPDRFEKDRAGWRELNKMIKADQRRWVDGMELALTRADDASDHPATSALLKVLSRKGGTGAMRQPTRKPEGTPYMSVDEVLAGWNDYFIGHFGATDRERERPPLGARAQP
eukprot:SAG11_NODE_7779_length_1097_cov_1.127255_1_plen_216_part_00